MALLFFQLSGENMNNKLQNINLGKLLKVVLTPSCLESGSITKEHFTLKV